MTSFEQIYPHIAEFVDGIGWIEIGHDEGPLGFIRAIDMGGLVWSSDDATYASLDDGLRALDEALAEWLEQNT